MIYFFSTCQMAFAWKPSRPFIHHKKWCLELRRSSLGISYLGQHAISWFSTWKTFTHAYHGLQNAKTRQLLWWIVIYRPSSSACQSSCSSNRIECQDTPKRALEQQWAPRDAKDRLGERQKDRKSAKECQNVPNAYAFLIFLSSKSARERTVVFWAHFCLIIQHGKHYPKMA